MAEPNSDREEHPDASLDLYWHDCPDCDGDGQSWQGKAPSGENILVICEMCQGEGGWGD